MGAEQVPPIAAATTLGSNPLQSTVLECTKGKIGRFCTASTVAGLKMPLRTKKQRTTQVL